eukprot:3307570-Lingulodinium_polyedra.AAC.1
MASQLARHGGEIVAFDQCRYGASTRKRADIAGVAWDLPLLASRCCHRRHDQPSGGRSSGGGFCSAGTE